MITWTSDSGEAPVLRAETQEQQKYNDTSGWVEVEAEPVVRGDSGSRSDEDTYLLHEMGCGGTVRLHFVLQVYE